MHSHSLRFALLHLLHQLKVLWYIWHTALESKPIRKNGVIIVQNNLTVKSKVKSPTKLLKRYIDFAVNIMPVKIGTCHDYSAPSSLWDKLVSKVKYRLGKRLRLRYVEYKIRADGDLEEINVRLGKKHGLRKEYLPTELGGSVCFEQYIDEWIEERRSKGL